MRIINQLHQRNWEWTYIAKMALSSTEEEQLRQAIMADVIIRSERLVFGADNSQHAVATVAPNFEHPLVKAVYHLIEWLPDRIAHCLHKRHMPYVDSNFLARGMTLDNVLHQLGIGQSRQEAEEWLNIAASIGIVVKKQQPHPNSPTKVISTWWPPEEHYMPNLADASRSQPTHTVNPPDERHYAEAQVSNRIKNTTAEPLKSGNSDMPPYGSYRAAFRQSTTTKPTSASA